MPGARLDTHDSSRFEVLSPLGRGGFGSVYEALDRQSGQRVALKELGQASGDSLARFKQEFRALSGLHHPNLVGLKELFEHAGRWFIVMELIAGHDFIRHVREPGAHNDNGREYDETRLRRALAGMAVGLSALHDFGVLHRDLKPSNVCVTSEGRAVLLDFGLVTSVDPTRQSTHGIGVGTVAYMAPEQALGRKIGPAADWYALGVCLFEALTDRLPFEGMTGLQLLLRKQQKEAPRASQLARSVPEDLDELCARLLSREPERRPSREEILTRLGVAAPEQPRSLRPAAHMSLAPQPLFAGREAELDNLERALQRTHDGELRVVLIEGESGVGKSELVQEFLRSVRLRHASLVTLSGRCYENEQLPYKAFDGCIDELAKLLRKLPEDECQELLPAKATLLGQLFPVLSHVPGVAKARRDQLSADPTARRLEAFAALAQLLGKLAEDRPVVLVIDDLQWADAESFRLMKALLDQPERPPLLIVATIRPREELDQEILAQVERVRAWQCTDVQPLHGLPASQAEALAGSLLGPLAAARWVRAIAEESRGHPLFLSELVHFAQSREIGATGVITLDAAIGARIERLNPPSRELIELAAVAARPYGSQIFARALSTDVERVARPLLQAKLLRARKGGELGCFHDRIRHVAVSLISRTRLPHLHHMLASALAEEASHDRAELARHWQLAGELERASSAYEQAAQQAMNALAFVRAAELSERALELMEETRDERYVRLLEQRANALACAGRSAHAATLYARAAELESGAARIRLRGSAANQLMLSAQVVPGLRAAREVLREVDVALPLEAGKALLRFMWERLRHALFARFVHLSAEEQRQRRLAIELIMSLNRSIAFVHPAGYLALTAQYVRLSTSLGDEAQLAYAYAAQGYLDTLRGSSQRGATMFARAREICARLGQPRLSAWQTLLEGTARLVGWDLEAAEVCMRRAHELLEAHCPDQPRELTLARFQLSVTWYLLGQHRQLATESERWLAEARERDDALGVALLLGIGYCFVRHLMRDAQAEAVAELEAAAARVPNEFFGIPQLGHLLAMQVSLFYQGGPTALRWLEARADEYKGPFLLKTAFGRQTFLLCSTIATLHACVTASGRERTRLMRSARTLAQEAVRHRAGIGYVFGHLALAQIEASLGNTRAAADHILELRKQKGTGLETTLGAQTLYLEGLLDRSGGGPKKCEQALETFRAQGWRSPERAVAINLPLLPLLAARPAPMRTRELVLSRYHVLSPVGRGGFGRVVEARDTQTDERVALKELVGRGAKPLERFKQEFRALQNVHHPNLVRLLSLFEQDGAWYIAMELVQGTDLTSHVHAQGELQLERVHHSFLQLACALSTLHEAGFVHRDVTPANLRVTSEGRLVLLDFGLIAHSGERQDGSMLGTAEYAAPEQLDGAPAAASADVFALGTCLYEALTGTLPFQAETPFALLSKKRAGVPRTRESGVSDELALCLRMLDPEPARRPNISEIIAFFAARDQDGDHGRRSLQPAGLASPLGVFSGRASELSRLEQALAHARTGALTLVLLEGESGLGKSAIVAEFVSRLEAAQAGCLVLGSRCYENEQVALKAFDGAVDQLAQALNQLSTPDCEQLLPRRAGLLAQLFPVLSGVQAITAAGKKGIPADPAARKLAAYDCFIQFLAKVAERFTLVLTVDDLQWADRESFRMLQQLLEQGPRLPLLIVCTARAERELDPGVAEEIGWLKRHRAAQTLSLSGLSLAEAGELAATLVGEEVPQELLVKLAQESKGHPLFLRELVERAKLGTLSQTAPGLDDAIRSRVERLDPDARAILDLVALAGRPYRARWLARALGRSALPREALGVLTGHALVRTRGVDELACYHDRVRHVIEQLLASTRRQSLVRRLAEALEEDPASDPAERARLWDAADAPEQAIAAYERAGERGLEGLAFGRAEQHYARALELLGARRDEVFLRVSVQRGQALVRMGQSAEAARVFQAAAEFAPAAEQARLRIWAAQHLIQSAQVAEGLRAASVLLSELSLPMATTDRQALARIGWERMRTALRGTKLRRRARAVSGSERLALDALHGLSSAVRAVSYLPGSTLVVQYLRRALDAGEPGHAARALAYEGLLGALSASSSQSALFAQSRELADATEDPAIVAEVELTRGLALVGRCEFAAAAEVLGFAHELLQSRCPGQPWLLTATRMYLGVAWNYMADYRSIAQYSAAWLDEAKAKQDRYAVAALVGLGAASFRHLLRDDPGAALQEVDEAMAPWPRAPFSTNHFGAFSARSFARIYAGGSDLWPWLQDYEQRIGREYLMGSAAFRLQLLLFRVIACLDVADGKQKPLLLASARRDAEALSRVRIALAPGTAQLCLATICALESRPEKALHHAREAQHQLKSAYTAQGGGYIEGLLEGGASGRARREAVLAWFQQRGFSNPERAVRLVVPGVELLRATLR